MENSLLEKQSLTLPTPSLQEIVRKLKAYAKHIGFQQIGIADVDLTTAESHLLNWLERGFHGEMHYMQRHGLKRSQPAKLQPGTIRVISGRMDYLPDQARNPQAVLADEKLAYVARYALGRDYHKMLRRRLLKLVEFLASLVGPYSHRVFTDSAPVMEKALAEKGGLGWIGKHTNLIAQQRGSWFFLGEIYTNLPLPVDTPSTNHCGTCQACIDICPTDAIIAPYQLDARRCISYLTIELRGSIPIALRPLIGNRIFGCDDCQLICPWNRFAQLSAETDFLPRHNLDAAKLVTLFLWSKQEFLKNTEGSPIRRIGYDAWLRNIAVALGNQTKDATALNALHTKLDNTPPLVRDHIQWAIMRHRDS